MLFWHYTYYSEFLTMRIVYNFCMCHIAFMCSEDNLLALYKVFFQEQADLHRNTTPLETVQFGKIQDNKCVLCVCMNGNAV